MKIDLLSPLKVFLLYFVAFIFFSCSKDSDLLSDYVITDDGSFNEIANLVVNDTYYVNMATNTVLDVLSNDQFTNLDNVTITGTSNPINGTVEINEDNTLTYVPSEGEEIDTFDYTAEEVTEDGTVNTAEGTVNISDIESKHPTSGPNVYYVTTSGKSTNNGKAENTAWDISHAFKTAKAGDIIHVKAGNYGNKKLSSSRNGTAEKPIKFIGYKNEPGDVLAINGPTFNYDDWKANGQSLLAGEMPWLNNNKDIPKTEERAFSLDHEYVEIHNFFITKYWTGVEPTADNVTIDNIIGDQFGVWNPANPCWNAADDGCIKTTVHRNGWGIVTAKNPRNLTIKNSLIIDAGFVSYFLIGTDNATVENSMGISHNTGNGSDYIFDFFNCTNSRIDNLYAERFSHASNGHRSRGLILQSTSDNNEVTNIVMVNLRMQIQHSRSNIFENVTIRATDASSNSDLDGSLQIASSADNNVFKDFIIDNCGGVSFLGVVNPVGPERYPIKSSTENSSFINFKITRVNGSGGTGVINFHRLSPGSENEILPATTTSKFIDSTFDGFPNFITANRGGTLEFINCSFSNAKGTEFHSFVNGAPWKDKTKDYNIIFKNCNWDSSNNYNIPNGAQWTVTGD